jgi:hypothetical protein
MEGGDAPVGSAGDGGSIILQAGPLDPGGDNGHIYIFGDGGSIAPTFGVGGDIQLAGATDPGVSAGGHLLLDGGGPLFGGNAFLQGGNGLGGSGLNGGRAQIAGGAGDSGGDGGLASVIGGSGGPTGDGGNTLIGGGTATGGVNTGGDVILRPGPGPGGDGLVKIEGRIDPAVGGGVAGIQFGTFFMGGPVPAAAPVPFNVPFGVAPKTVLLSMEAAAVALPPGNDVTPTIAPGSITPIGFTVNMTSAAAIPGPITLHWVAYL